MTKAKGHILPFFIPHLGCPCQCIFCDQKTISGTVCQPTAEEILQAMEMNRGTGCHLAFYGGSFTAMPKEKQLYYLQAAQIGMEKGWIQGIRLSTRPDSIDEEIINILLEYGVDTVELGVQSLNNETLALSKRGHTAEDSLLAVKKLKTAGIAVGIQLMPGLPQDSFASIVMGAESILKLHPDLLRIYPAVVISGTEMADMYTKKEYTPLSLAKAVEISAVITLLADKYKVNVIRTGLNTDEHLAEEVVAGPYHPAFGHLVKSYIWREKLLWALEDFLRRQTAEELLAVFAAKSKLPMVFGQNSANRLYYEAKLPNQKLKIKSFNSNIYSEENNIILLDKAEKKHIYADKDFNREFLSKVLSSLYGTCC